MAYCERKFAQTIKGIVLQKLKILQYMGLSVLNQNYS